MQTGHGSGWPGRAAVGVRVEHPHDAGQSRLGGPAARVAGERDSAGGRTVVAAVARDDLVAARVPAGELDRVLVRLGAAVREERHAEVARRHFRQELPEAGARLGRHRRPDRRELLRLVLDRLDDLRVRVADRDVDELRGEVEVRLAVVVVEVAPFRALDRDRVDRVLDAPGVEDVVLRVLDDLPTQLGVASRSSPCPKPTPGVRLAPMICPACGAENRAGARFCDNCGAALPAEAVARGAEGRHGALLRRHRLDGAGRAARPRAAARRHVRVLRRRARGDRAARRHRREVHRRRGDGGVRRADRARGRRAARRPGGCSSSATQRRSTCASASTRARS